MLGHQKFRGFGLTTPYKSTLELASGTSIGTISGIGSSLTGFGNLTVDAGADWTLSGSNKLTGGDVTVAGTLGSGGAGLALTSSRVDNTGSLSGTSFGVVLSDSGSLTNSGSLTSSGGNAVDFYGNSTAAATGVIVNNAGDLISGVIGVRGRYGSITLTNAGTITGTGGTAVQLNEFQTNRVIVDPGAVFNGTVNGGNPGVYAYKSTLELASEASAGTLTGLGSQFTNFGNIVLDSGAQWSIATDTAGLSGTISGFAAGDTIEVTGITAIGSSYSGGVLTLDETSGATTLNLPGTFSTNSFAVQNVSGGAEVTVLCFLAGTQIRTPSGDVAVERLAAGETVCTWDGGTRPIVWVGQGNVLATPGRRDAATPVIVRKGALADNVPARDLHVTKGHSLLVDGVLIPVEFLVNHRSIVWDDRARVVTLYHVELDRHDILIADGAPAESYRDDGNRWLFQNANAGWDLPPQPACLPVLTGGAVVDAAWRRLLDRAGPRPGLPLTDDPDLHLLVDGVRTDPLTRRDLQHVFAFPAAAREIRIVSRAAVPSELGLVRDFRELGVALRRVEVRQSSRLRLVEAEDPRLGRGFHPFEPDNGFRWTNGDALLPSALFEGCGGRIELVLHLGMTTHYLDDGPVTQAA